MAAREVLVHLNVTVPDGDTRDADEIGQAVMNAYGVGSDDASVSDLEVVVALADDLGEVE